MVLIHDHLSVIKLSRLSKTLKYRKKKPYKTLNPKSLKIYMKPKSVQIHYFWYPSWPKEHYKSQITVDKREFTSKCTPEKLISYVFIQKEQTVVSFSWDLSFQQADIFDVCLWQATH